jgi:hypothetical protein
LRLVVVAALGGVAGCCSDKNLLVVARDTATS